MIRTDGYLAFGTVGFTVDFRSFRGRFFFLARQSGRRGRTFAESLVDIRTPLITRPGRKVDEIAEPANCWHGGRTVDEHTGTGVVIFLRRIESTGRRVKVNRLKPAFINVSGVRRERSLPHLPIDGQATISVRATDERLPAIRNAFRRRSFPFLNRGRFVFHRPSSRRVLQTVRRVRQSGTFSFPS